MITCEQCAYWERREGEVGWCRRESPGRLAYGWPISHDSDWCGLAVPRDAGGAMAVVEAAQDHPPDPRHAGIFRAAAVTPRCGTAEQQTAIGHGL